MVTRDRPTPFNFERWGFDNGAFGAWLKGKMFPESDFLKRLDAAEAVTVDPIVAVTPDIVAGGTRSLDFSVRWRMSHRLPSHWPWYLAVQDGMMLRDVASCLHLFDGIFLGGTDRFKQTAFQWCELAHGYQKKFHYGRAGTPSKMLGAYKVGSDSLDSSFPLWSHERLALFIKRWTGLGMQRTIEGVM